MNQGAIWVHVFDPQPFHRLSYDFTKCLARPKSSLRNVQFEAALGVHGPEQLPDLAAGGHGSLPVSSSKNEK